MAQSVRGAKLMPKRIWRRGRLSPAGCGRRSVGKSSPAPLGSNAAH